MPFNQHERLKFSELEPGMLYKTVCMLGASDHCRGADNGGRHLVVTSDTLVLLVEIFNYEGWELKTRLLLLTPDGQLLYTWGNNLSGLKNV